MFDREFLQLPKIRMTLVCLAAFSLFEAFCIIGQAIGLSCALVQLWQGASFPDVLVPFAVFSCSFVAVRIVLNMREAFIGSYATRCTMTMRESLLASIFRTGAPAIQRFGTGSTSVLVLDGIDKVRTYLELVLPKFVNMIVLPIVFAIMIALADWVSGIVVVILLPSMALLMVLIGKTTADRGREQHASFKVMSNHFIDSVRGISTLSTFEVSKTYAHRVFAVSERFREATMRTLRTATLSGSVLDLFATLAIAAVSIMLGLRLIDGTLVLLPALFVLILTPEYFRPIREFASDHHASLDGANSLRSMNEILEATSSSPASCFVPTWNAKSTLRVTGLSKDYAGASALESVSFECEGLQVIGVVGMSGSGKSTFLRLLAGLEDPSNGSIQIDRECMLDTLRCHRWQEQIAYIPQDPYIFALSLRENLALYDPTVTDEQIVHALEVVGLDHLVDSLPQGLDTLIGEGGRGLSGGQAQRIALARVVLDTKRKIVLFDEPTAHLDIETEYELKLAMLEVMKDKLVIFATHRLHWVDSFDRVLVLDEGSIVEAGTPEELRASGRHFERLVAALQGGGAA